MRRSAAGPHVSERLGVQVRLLGPIEVHGAARPFSRAWSLDLVAYLALHRGGASTEMWSTALWPERLARPSTRHSVVSAARRSLGADRAGVDHLPHERGHLRLGPSVTTDVEGLFACAAIQDAATWARGLRLVRGRPFEGLRASDWPIVEGLASMVEAEVAALALRLAAFRLDSGDHEAARWAARTGLMASPYDERLYRCLLHSARAAGNPAAADQAMAELCARMGVEGGRIPDELRHWVDPATEALYRALPGRGPATKRVPARL